MARSQDHSLEEGTAVNLMENEERVNLGSFAMFQGGLVSCFGTMANVLESSKKIHDPQGPFLQKWNKIFLISCVIAVSLDPLFLYIPVVNHNKKCFELDNNLGITATVLRTITDILSIIHIVFQFRTGFYGEDDALVNNAWKIAKRYLSSYFAINVLAIFPLPQVVLLIIIPKAKGSVGSKVKSWLIFVVFLQYLSRVYQIFPAYKRAARTSGLVSVTAWAKAACNLLLYMLASHIVGASWYFFSIERETACWRKACENYIGCVHGSFFCDDNVGNYTFLDEFCPINMPNTTQFDFGIFTDALRSGIVESTDFPEKLLHCFWWGLQNLSSLGQSLKTSNSIWEICFAVGISISGLVLLVFLIGNMQTYLQSQNARSEQMRLIKKEMMLKVEKIDKWMTSRKLTVALRNQIKDFLQSNWQKTEGVDEKNLLYHLPEELGRNVKHELCLKLLNKVPKFVEMGEQMLHELCDRVKPVFHTERSDIVHGGDPTDQMLFITWGRLCAYPTSGAASSTKRIMKGDYCGEELIDWALTSARSNSILPISTKTIKADTDVEGFALVAVDLKSVITKFLLLYNQQRPHNRLIATFEATLAASFIQIIYRHRRSERSPGDLSRSSGQRGSPKLSPEKLSGKPAPSGGQKPPIEPYNEVDDDLHDI